MHSKRIAFLAGFLACLASGVLFVPSEARAHGAALDPNGCHRVEANQAEHCHNPAYRAKTRRVLDGGRLKVRAQFSPLPDQGVNLLVRLKGVDVPQTWGGTCRFERDLAAKARALLQKETREGVLLFDVESDAADGAARSVRAHVFTPQFVSLADRLVAEGLARPLAEGRHPWCNGGLQAARPPAQPARFYLLGMVGGSVLALGPDSPAPNGSGTDRVGSSLASIGGGYVRTLYRALFASLEGTLDYHAVPQAITAYNRAHESRVQFGMVARLGWSFALAQASFFVGPHWAQIASKNGTRQLGTSVWQGWRVGGGLLYPLTEQWGLSTEYRFARVQGSAGGSTDTLDYHAITFGLRYDF